MFTFMNGRSGILLLFFLILCLIFPFQNPSAQEAQADLGSGDELFSTLKGNFIRVLEKPGSADTMSGAFWFLEKRKMLLLVDYPVNQQMMLSGLTTSIYYPDFKYGFKLISKLPPLLPIVPSLTAYVRPDAGIGDIGYTLKSFSSNGDTIISIWTNPKLGKKAGTYTLVRFHGRLIRTHLEFPESEREFTIEFSDFAPINGIPVPTAINTRRLESGSEYNEWVYLSDLAADIEVPDSIRNYRMPSDAKVETKEW